MVDIPASNADGLRGPDAVELVTKPLESNRQGYRRRGARLQPDRRRSRHGHRALPGRTSRRTLSSAFTRKSAPISTASRSCIPEPLIVGRGIDDVAVTVLTLAPRPDAADRWTDKDLYELADKLRSELMKVDSIGLTYIPVAAPSKSGWSPIRETVVVRA